MPVISVTGPRQSGKTTMVKALFPDYHYVNLENPVTRSFAIQDPLAFLKTNKRGIIIDEPQHAPELFSWIQVLSDEQKKNGAFILTGSQNFLLLEKISQSLAGRVAIFQLLPFGFPELQSAPLPKPSLNELLLKGSYPRLYDQQVAPDIFYPSYIATYVERDIRSVLKVKNLDTFQRFLVMLAARIGQLLNFSNISNELGVSIPTLQQWFSLLESSFITFKLTPFLKNYNKRINKTGKAYFYDTGLACSLLNIRSEEELAVHPLRGSLFENWVIVETAKQFYNKGIRPDIFFWRDRSGNEVDLLVNMGLQFHAVEIKSGSTMQERFLKGLKRFEKIAGEDIIQSLLVYGGEESLDRSNERIRSWSQLPKFV
jgi:predicted AAA+ superfamily ATPase